MVQNFENCDAKFFDGESINLSNNEENANSRKNLRIFNEIMSFRSSLGVSKLGKGVAWMVQIFCV